MHLLFDYLSTLIVSLLLIGLIVLIIYRMRKDKKQGKSCCGGNCGHCQMGCHYHDSNI